MPEVGVGVYMLDMQTEWAASARLELSDFWLDYGEVQVGDQESDSIQLENTGDVPV